MSLSPLWRNIFFYRNDLKGLHSYEVLLLSNRFVVVLVHCHQVKSVVCIHASCRKANTVSYLVFHRVWNEELASYLDREVWRGTLPMATNTFPVHRVEKKHASWIVCQPTMRKLVNIGCERLEKQWRGCCSQQREKVSDLETVQFMTLALRRMHMLLSPQPQTHSHSLCSAHNRSIRCFGFSLGKNPGSYLHLGLDFSQLMSSLYMCTALIYLPLTPDSHPAPTCTSVDIM